MTWRHSICVHFVYFFVYTQNLIDLNAHTHTQSHIFCPFSNFSHSHTHTQSNNNQIAKYCKLFTNYTVILKFIYLFIFGCVWIVWNNVMIEAYRFYESILNSNEQIICEREKNKIDFLFEFGFFWLFFYFCCFLMQTLACTQTYTRTQLFANTTFFSSLCLKCKHFVTNSFIPLEWNRHTKFSKWILLEKSSPMNPNKTEMSHSNFVKR